MHSNHYSKLIIMIVLSFIAMYGLMYVMVDSFSNAYHNINQFYMAGLMTAAMVIIELVVMSGMYGDLKRNILIIGFSFVIGILFFVGIRMQTGITDRQFLRSMIPHHAAAILMCQQTELNDMELKNLCQSITNNQQSEITWMKTKLKSLNK